MPRQIFIGVVPRRNDQGFATGCPSLLIIYDEAFGQAVGGAPPHRGSVCRTEVFSPGTKHGGPRDRPPLRTPKIKMIRKLVRLFPSSSVSGGTLGVVAELGLVLSKQFVHQGNGQLTADKLALPGHGDGLARRARGRLSKTCRGAGMESGWWFHGLGQAAGCARCRRDRRPVIRPMTRYVARGSARAAQRGSTRRGAGQTHELAAVLAAPAHVQRVSFAPSRA